MDNNKIVPQQSQEQVFKVDVLDFWDAFKKGWWAVLLAFIIATAGMITFREVTFVPRYSSTSTLYILFDGFTDNLQNAQNAYSLSKTLVSDCEYALKSQSVINTTIDKIDFEYAAIDLAASITTKNPEDTRYILVSVSADTPEHAKILVDTLCETCQEQMAAAAGDNQQVNVYAKGSEPILSNAIIETSYIKYGVAAAVLVYGIFVLCRILDDRFRDDDDVENTLGITILGTVPNADVQTVGGRYAKYTRSSEYGKYGYYGNYGKQSQYYGKTDTHSSDNKVDLSKPKEEVKSSLGFELSTKAINSIDTKETNINENNGGKK